LLLVRVTVVAVVKGNSEATALVAVITATVINHHDKSNN
jgi:hypothetical protein